jgi:hypothetical protein
VALGATALAGCGATASTNYGAKDHSIDAALQRAFARDPTLEAALTATPLASPRCCDARDVVSERKRHASSTI